jgi:hypothetical protein
MARNYSSVVEPKTLTANITDSAATQITLNNVTSLPSPPYVLVINPDTAKEEVVLVTVDQAGVTAPTLKVQRAIEAVGGVGIARNNHTIGDVVKHMVVGSDLQIVHDHFSNDSTTAGTAHGTTGGVVGRTTSQTLTNKTINLSDNTITGTKAQFNTALSDADFATITGTETLTNKTLTSPKINEDVVITATATELNYVDGVTSAIQTQLDAKAPLSPGKNVQTSTPYTLVLGDAGKYVEMNNASANSLIVPPNSSVAFPIGTEITIIQTGAGATTITPGLVSSGPDVYVTVNYYSLTGAATRIIKAQWSAATLIKRDTNTWVLIGNLQ